MMYLVKTPIILQKLYPRLTWRSPTTEKNIYLTFDDGPTPEVTSFVLQELKKHQAKATFFCIGKNIEKHSGIFQEIVKDGHAIGNHTYSHKNGWNTNLETYHAEIKKTDEILKEYNVTTKLFRPPYGRIKKKQIKSLKNENYNIIMWDVLSADFDIKSSQEQCLHNVLENTKEGSIVVFHDSTKASKRLYYILPKILEYFSKQGFEFKGL